MSDDPMLAKAAQLEQELLEQATWTERTGLYVAPGRLRRAALLIQQLRLRVESNLQRE